MGSDSIRRNAGFLLGLVSSATYGLIPLFSLPLIRAGVSVETTLVYRFAIATVIMGPILAMKGERFAVRGIEVLKLAVLSCFYMFAVLVFFHAFSYMASGLVATIQFLYPVMVMMIMIFFFHERFCWHIALSIILAMAGVAFLSCGPELEPALESGARPPCILGLSAIVVGVILSLLAGLGNGLYFVGIQVARIPNISSMVMTFYVMLIGTVICFINALICGSLQWLSTPEELSLAFMLALVTAVISNLTLIMAIQRIGSTLTSVLGVMEPLTAVAVGTMVFGEPFTIWIFGGIVMIVISVLLIILWPEKS